MYKELFEKCGLVKGDEYVVAEYEDGGYENVREVWIDEEDGIEFIVFEDGSIEENCFRGNRTVSVEHIKWLYHVEN